MRLNDQPHIFQIGHLVADRGGTEIQIRKLLDGSRSNRLACLQIGLDDRFQNGPLSVIKLHLNPPFLFLLALVVVEC